MEGEKEVLYVSTASPTYLSFYIIEVPRVCRPFENGHEPVLTGQEVASPSGWKCFCLKLFSTPNLVPKSTDE
jgi:hypothetical protein